MLKNMLKILFVAVIMFAIGNPTAHATNIAPNIETTIDHEKIINNNNKELFEEELSP